MKAIIWDCETNGKPRGKPKGKTFKDDIWPRITQLAWVVMCMDTGRILLRFNYIIKPDGWTVPCVEEQILLEEKNPYFFEDNNISTERCEREGLPLPWVLGVFIRCVELVKVMVAHNLQFDLNVVGSEMIRYDMRSINKPLKICSMETTKYLLNIPSQFKWSREPKWPSLAELHHFLFFRDFEGAHDALSDVEALAACFFYLHSVGFYYKQLENIK